MVSVRKKYRVESPDLQVSTAPIEAAKPPPVAESKPVEQQPETDPVEQAARSAIQDRLEEVKHAEELVRSSSQSRLASEPQPQVDPLEQAIANLPERAKGWYRKDPSFLTDPEKAAQVSYAHHVAARETGAEGSDSYFDRMEEMLGLRPKPAAPAPAPAPRSNPPLRQSSVSVSAPVHREAPSLSTGRPQSEPVRLTPEELELARTLGLKPEEYRAGKERMLREKQAGMHSDGR